MDRSAFGSAPSSPSGSRNSRPPSNATSGRRPPALDDAQRRRRLGDTPTGSRHSVPPTPLSPTPQLPDPSAFSLLFKESWTIFVARGPPALSSSLPSPSSEGNGEPFAAPARTASAVPLFLPMGHINSLMSLTHLWNNLNIDKLLVGQGIRLWRGKDQGLLFTHDHEGMRSAASMFHRFGLPTTPSTAPEDADRGLELWKVVLKGTVPQRQSARLHAWTDLALACLGEAEFAPYSAEIVGLTLTVVGLGTNGASPNSAEHVQHLSYDAELAVVSSRDHVAGLSTEEYLEGLAGKLRDFVGTRSTVSIEPFSKSNWLASRGDTPQNVSSRASTVEDLGITPPEVELFDSAVPATQIPQLIVPDQHPGEPEQQQGPRLPSPSQARQPDTNELVALPAADDISVEVEAVLRSKGEQPLPVDDIPEEDGGPLAYGVAPAAASGRQHVAGGFPQRDTPATSKREPISALSVALSACDALDDAVRDVVALKATLDEILQRVDDVHAMKFLDKACGTQPFIAYKKAAVIRLDTNTRGRLDSNSASTKWQVPLAVNSEDLKTAIKLSGGRVAQVASVRSLPQPPLAHLATFAGLFPEVAPLCAVFEKGKRFKIEAQTWLSDRAKKREPSTVTRFVQHYLAACSAVLELSGMLAASATSTHEAHLESVQRQEAASRPPVEVQQVPHADAGTLPTSEIHVSARTEEIGDAAVNPVTVESPVALTKPDTSAAVRSSPVNSPSPPSPPLAASVDPSSPARSSPTRTPGLLADAELPSPPPAAATAPATVGRSSSTHEGPKQQLETKAAARRPSASKTTAPIRSATPPLNDASASQGSERRRRLSKSASLPAGVSSHAAAVPEPASKNASTGIVVALVAVALAVGTASLAVLLEQNSSP
jgi:hypothetical protein